MAYGTNVVIPSGSHVQENVPSGMSFSTLAILNPNDGIVYVATNRDLTDINPGSWDWKVPSQSYVLLPGSPKWQTCGLFYLDQSGAGRAGEITFYPINKTLEIPIFQSIGRALQAQQTALDITEGAQPANPGAGILRLWADGTDFLHALNGANVDATLIDTLTTLGGVLVGTLPNPGIKLTWSQAQSTLLSNQAANTTIDICSLALSAGTYLVSSVLQTASWTANENTFTHILANSANTVLLSVSGSSPASGNNTSSTLTRVVQLAAADTLKMRCSIGAFNAILVGISLVALRIA